MRSPQPAAIAQLGKILDPKLDALVMPARSGLELFPSDLIRQAVDTGVPVWVVPVHRRYEVQHFVRLGVQGMISPDLGYLSRSEPTLTTDTWSAGAISAGELTRDPYSDGYGLHWEEQGVIGLDVRDRPAFVALGQFCPLSTESYRLAFDASFDPLPTDTWQHLSVAFGHADDRYYEHRLAQSDGYHATLRADGRMAIFAHVQGEPNGRPLTASRQSTPFKNGLWTRLTLDVTPTTIRLTRDDGNYRRSPGRSLPRRLRAHRALGNGREAQDPQPQGFLTGQHHRIQSSGRERRNRTRPGKDNYSGTTWKSAMLATIGALVAEPDR